MPRRNHRPQHTSRKTIAKTEAERQQRRERDAELGGWFSRFKIDRQRREQGQNGQTKGR